MIFPAELKDSPVIVPGRWVQYIISGVKTKDAKRRHGGKNNG